MKGTNMKEITQSIIMPYHRNKQMLLYTTQLLNKIIPKEVEIIIVGNNDNAEELNVNLPDRFTYIKFDKSLLYSETVNRGVRAARGEIITLCDQDIFSYQDWYSPLLNKLLSNEHIGSVSSKLINPINNRIIDFGIEYSQYRILHPFRGLKETHPLVQQEYKMTSTTSATLMLRKEVYEKVGGMDLDMPYCCSDCDIGIKIGKLGLENWVVASSVAYHRGSSSAQNGKSSSFSYLRNDSTNMFWAKNYYNVHNSIGNTISTFVQYLKSEIHLEPLYYFVNLSSLREYEWYADYLMKSLSCDFCDIHSYPQSLAHYSSTLQLYDALPYTFMNVQIPIIYFVDYFPSLENNQIWAHMRNIAKDLVLDSHGNLVRLEDIILGKV